MNVERPILGCFALPGRTTLAVLIGLIAGGTALIMTFPNAIHLQTYAPVMVIPLALGIGVPIDNARRGRRHATTLAPHGFEICDAESADPAVDAAAMAMAPDALDPDERLMLVVGEVRGRTVYLANYSFNGVCRYAFAAVQTARVWPDAIVRRKRITGNLRGGHDLGDRAFNRQREILSDAPAEAMRPFERLARWFVTDGTVRKSFRMHETPGKNEQWSFGGHWAALADHGHAGPKQLLQLADFLVAFAEAADALDDPAAPGPDETEPD